MKKRLLLSCLAIIAILLLTLSACGGSGGTTGSTPSAPAIAKVKIWLTLSNNPDAPPVTTLTPEQTVQASIWARGTTEENLTFKVNLNYGDKFTTLATGVRTEGSNKAVAVGGFATPLEPGEYTFQAVSGAFGSIIGSTTFTVAQAAAESTSPTPAPVSTLSEQLDKATFSKYFSDMGLGKLPADAKSPQELQRNVANFLVGDPLTLYGTAIQEVQITAKYYNVVSKQSVDAPTPPTPLKVGGFASSSILDLPIGKYEYKVYVANVLVGVFPFEVVAPQTPAPTTTPSATLSEQPDQATFQKYFSEMGLGKMPTNGKFPQDLQRNATVFTTGDQICLYGNIILECQLRNTVYDVGAKKVIQEGGLPKPMTGGFAGWEPLTIPAGKYEYKVYITDVLVAVFPFEVTTSP